MTTTIDANLDSRTRKGGIRLFRQARNRKIVKYRTYGWTYDEIAKEMGMSVGGVVKVIYRAFEKLEADITKSTKVLRQIQLEQDQVAIKAIMPLVEAGDLAAIDRMLAIQTRVAKLCGLDLAGPDQHTHQSITQIQLVEKLVVTAPQQELPAPIHVPMLTAQDVSGGQSST